VKKERRPPADKPVKHKEAKRHSPLRYYFALLYVSPAPEKPLDLEVEDSEKLVTSFRFIPLRDTSELKATIGLLAVDASLAELTLARLTGLRLAGQISGELVMQVLADAPTAFDTWPAPKRQGLLKGLQRALTQLSTTPPLPHRFWLAQQFAVYGYASVPALAKVLARTGDKTANWPSSVAKTTNWWIWRDAAAQWVEKLVQEIKRVQRRNSYFDEVHVSHVQQWLGLEHPELTEYVLKAFAPVVNKRVKAYADGTVVPLAGELLPAPPVPAEMDIARRILDSYSTGEGRSLAGLEKAYPSHRHIVAALVEARLLVQGPDAYVFSRKQLRAYSVTLADANKVGGAPSVRLIKDTLELERRPAEALRAYLAAGPLRELAPTRAPRSSK
jgi:hypothetical protein